MKSVGSKVVMSGEERSAVEAVGFDISNHAEDGHSNRMVTHDDVDRSGIDRALRAMRAILNSGRAASPGRGN